jgi:hypothetical protein
LTSYHTGTRAHGACALSHAKSLFRVEVSPHGLDHHPIPSPSLMARGPGGAARCCLGNGYAIVVDHGRRFCAVKTLSSVTASVIIKTRCLWNLKKERTSRLSLHAHCPLEVYRRFMVFRCAWCFGKSIRGRGSLNFAFLHLGRDLAQVFFFAKPRPSPSLLRHCVVVTVV